MRIYQDPKARVYRVPSYPVPCNGSLICMGCLTLGAHIPPQGSQGFQRRAKQRRDQRVMAVHNAREQTVKDPKSKRLQAYAPSSSSSVVKKKAERMRSKTGIPSSCSPKSSPVTLFFIQAVGGEYWRRELRNSNGILSNKALATLLILNLTENSKSGNMTCPRAGQQN